MTEVERIECRKAYVELNEIIKRMPIVDKQKIPKEFKKNLYIEMDKNYNFSYDDEKGILEQKIKVETKALLVELYEKFFAPEEEKKSWKKYDQICLNMLEAKKRIKYNPDHLFENESQEINDDPKDKIQLEVKKSSILKKIFELVKHIYK